MFGVGTRMKLSYTRAMVHSALIGELNDAETTTDEIFGLAIPKSIPGVPDEVLVPKNAWADKESYELEAKKLAGKFHMNFEKFTEVSETIQQAGPLYRPV